MARATRVWEKLVELARRPPHYFSPPNPGATAWVHRLRERMIVLGIACTWATVAFGLYAVVAETNPRGRGVKSTYERIRMPAVPMRIPTGYGRLMPAEALIAPLSALGDPGRTTG